jgi:hypothetical protein
MAAFGTPARHGMVPHRRMHGLREFVPAALASGQRWICA